MFVQFILTTICFVTTAFSVTLAPCKKTDMECVTKSFNDAHSTVFRGIPSQGIDSSDPLYLDFIKVNIGTLNGTFTNSTITGFKDCTMENVKLYLESLKFYYEMDCPLLSLSGNYEINGKLILMEIEGKGTYNVKSGRYKVFVDADMKSSKGNDGKTYLNFKSFTVKAEALAPVVYDFKNLFNGQKDLSDSVHKFANENWQEVTNMVQDPAFNKYFKEIHKNYNKFLKTVPIEDTFLD